MKSESPDPLGVALISPPWPLYNRPSIQIATLKAYLETCFPRLQVKAYHAYLEVAASIGYPLYQGLSERTWLAEPIYAALMFPEKKEAAGRLFKRHASENARVKKIPFSQIVERIQKITEKILDGISLESLHVVGLSACLCQLSASLYFIRQIKKRRPQIKIVLGGSSFSGLSGEALFQFFPEIDFLVNGEGERPLGRILEYLIDPKKMPPRIPSVRGVLSKATSTKDEEVFGFDQLPDLKDLPPPDYDDYFALLKGLPVTRRFFPILPVEGSRGCWWHRQTKGPRGGRRGCAFCNLNLQWRGYRSKGSRQAAREVDHLSEKHRILSLAFTDNILSPGLSKTLFETLASRGKEYHLFCEIRPDTPKGVLERMERAGVREVQIGIEALSTPLLRKMNKGTTALKNLEIMKHCEALGITSLSNLILYFPSSKQADVEETLRLLEFALPFRPLRTVGFWLGRGSPVWEDPGAFGVSGIKNHPNYGYLFPKAMTKALPLMIQTYRGDRTHQRRLWRPVKERVIKWKKDYEHLRRKAEKGPILSFLDGGSFLMIQQRRPHAPTLTHRLEGTSRSIYLYCDTVRSLQEIFSRFKGVSKEQGLSFLKMMVQKRLMAEEGDSYLSLAIPRRIRT